MMTQMKRIFIVGLPGAGKALLAKTVAEKLGWQFIDADLGLEFHVGRPVKEILGKEGQEHFYQCESEILAAQIAKENIVVATDSSIVCSKKNQELLSSEFVVFLQASTSTQLERISRHEAPLLPDSDLKALFDTFHAERDDLFEKVATVSIQSDDGELNKHVDFVIKSVSENAERQERMTDVKLDKKDLILFHKTSHTPVHLSEQQAVSLKLLAQGKSSKEIARDMHISYRTVEGTLAKTMELLGCTSSKELIVLYHGHH